MNESEADYIRELAADIKANGGLNGLSLSDAIIQAHNRRQAFIAEMAQQETKRSRMAYEALTASIFVEVHASHAVDRALMRCAYLHGPSQ